MQAKQWTTTLGLALLLAAAGCAPDASRQARQDGGADMAADPPVDALGLEAAALRFPPAVPTAALAPNPADGGMIPRSCPAKGARFVQVGGPTFEYLGADPKQPDLCDMRVDGQPLQAWFAIWGVGWAGGDRAYPALKRSMAGPTGDVLGFNTVAKPTAKWHDLVRQEGIERIYILGKTYTAMKLAHYREGYGGNDYRSVSSVWKDVETGMLVYGNYRHISGTPELEGQLIPESILAKP